MGYYKVIVNNTIIGVASEANFFRYKARYNNLLSCTSAGAQYLWLENNNTYYYDKNWMSFPVANNIPYEEATIQKIDKQEYDMLYQAIEAKETIIIEEPEIEENFQEEYNDPIEELTVDYIRSTKLLEMSSICNKTITNGFDIQLSDGDTYHFSLTTQDQLNLITLATMVESSETQIPYHADGEPCKFYSTLDMKTIIDKATEFKTYHTSYYNSLKTYINSMETMEEISEVTYGIEIPEEYQSEVLKSLNFSVN